MQQNEIEALFREKAAETQLKATNRRERLLAEARALLRTDESDSARYIFSARMYKQLGRLAESLAILSQGISRCPPSARLYEYYIERLEKCNRTEAAIETARQARKLFPDELVFRLREALTLPIVYDSRRQVELYRQRFAENLQRLISEVPLGSPVEQQLALSAISRSSNKYLPYQGRNDRDFQAVYNTWVQRIMQLNYPEWAKPDAMPSLGGKVRIGFLTSFSTRFLNLSAGKLFGGWVQDLDRTQFEVFAYHADNLADHNADVVLRWDIPFRQLSGDIEGMTRAIRLDRLHVLICLDFGIHPRMAQLASLHLAPIQCVSWDTPVTSGLPAMDYFLSSDLMEPPDAASHYSEKLVRLPGVGACFRKPVIPTPMFFKRRNDFGLRDDAVVYLCCQSIFKYSPEQDEVVSLIAKRIPNSQFVFLTTNDVVAGDLRNRLARVFASANLEFRDYCVLLPEMDTVDYWNLLCLGDVSLDTLGWSGGVSTFEAVACGLPVVTLPGEWMRSRHTYAILTQLNVTETIARDPEEYIEIAVRLGVDRKWRQSVVDRLGAGYPALYSDSRSVQALQNFLRRIVSERIGV